MSLDWVAQQIANSQQSRKSLNLAVSRYQPRSGVPQEGGAAKAVLSFLQAHPEQYFAFSQIVTHTKRTPKSLDWACIFLRSLGYVECARDDGRNSRYLRYRIVK